jgi:hypothetical protein
MRGIHAKAAVVGALGLLIWPGASRADGDSLGDTLGPRSIGVGDALRANAIGGAATTLNPAGAALARTYVLEGSYGFRPEDDGTVAAASICDSVTKPWLAACLYYSYFSTTTEGMGRSLHDVGLTIALPLGERFVLGTTTRYIDYTDEMTPANSRDGAVVLDVGSVLRLTPMINFAFVGYNVAGSDGQNFPRGLGTGLSLSVSPKLLLALDALWNLDLPEGTPVGRYGGGAEFFIAADDGQQGYPLRGGYVYDATTGGSYVTAGVGFMTPRVALDVGLRKQVDAGDELLVQFGLRVFMPTQ